MFHTVQDFWVLLAGESEPPGSDPVRDGGGPSPFLWWRSRGNPAGLTGKGTQPGEARRDRGSGFGRTRTRWPGEGMRGRHPPVMRGEQGESAPLTA